MTKIIKQSLLFAVAVFAYVFGVAQLMSRFEQVGGPKDSVLGPVGFLLLFVVSAGVTGSLVFGKPVALYLDGQKKEAIQMAIYNLIFLAIMGGIVLFYLYGQISV